MKKTALIPAVIVGLIGIAFASTAMFPNTPEFPSVPIQPGTIGGAITQLFNADGSAKNTQKLNGVTASGYLQNQNCNQSDPLHNVWVGVDPNGKAICGHRITPLASIGKFYEIHGIILVKKGGVGAGTPANTTDDLLPGDIIVTNSSATGTIKFTSDLSILRLDTNTTVALSTGENTSGQSVAQAILSDGRLWGRIITSTGVNLGGGGLVAGVRGTSVSVEKGTTGLYTLSVIDSQYGTTGPTAAIVTNTSNPEISISMPKENQIVYLSGGIIPGTSTPVVTATPVPKISLLTGSLWVRENTKADIEYLADAGSSSPVLLESAATVPPSNNIPMLTALCNQEQTYWESLIGVDHYSEKCQNANIIAYADYTKSIQDAKLYKNDAGKVSPTPSTYSPTGSGIQIGTSQYLEYSTGELGDLAGRTITIELKNLIPNTTTTPIPKYYVLDFGGSIQVYKKGATWYCLWNNTNPATCTTSSTTPTLTIPDIIEDGTKLTIHLPNDIIPTKILIGNSPTLVSGQPYQMPIGNTIQSILIQ